MIPKWLQNWSKNRVFRDMVILWKVWFFLRKNAHFEVLSIQKVLQNRMKNLSKSMLEKTMQKWCNIEPKWSQNGTKIDQKSIKNESQKNDEFSEGGRRNFHSPGSPKTHTIQQDKQQINSRKTKKEDNLQKITYRTSSKGNLLIDDLQS